MTRMAKPPTCRKCGNPHWSQEGCARIESVGPGRTMASGGVIGATPIQKAQKSLPDAVPGKTLITQGKRPPQSSKPLSDRAVMKVIARQLADEEAQRPKGRDKTAYNAYQRKYQANVRKENRALRVAAGMVKRKPGRPKRKAKP